MKKTIALILVFAILSVFLTACGGQEKNENEVPQTSIPATEAVVSTETANLLDKLSFNLPSGSPASAFASAELRTS